MSHPTWRTGPRFLFHAEGAGRRHTNLVLRDSFTVMEDAAPPEPRCVHCGKRKGDHGLMSGHCFRLGRVVRTKFEAAEVPNGDDLDRK